MPDLPEVVPTSWSADQVLQASADWTSVWFPPDSVHVDAGWLEFYLRGGIASIMRANGAGMTAPQLVDRVLAELRNHGATGLRWAVGPKYSPAGVDELLLERGARVDSLVDIRAYPLDRPLPDDELPEGATARPVRSRDDVAQFERVNSLAWGYPPPTDELIDRTYANLTRGYFTGYWNDIPAGAGGYGLVGAVARFWGTAVVPEFRGRGVYRALVRARLADASSRGATLALVHAKEQTSSPILQRLGFAVYGQLKVLAFRLDAGDGR